MTVRPEPGSEPLSAHWVRTDNDPWPDNADREVWHIVLGGDTSNPTWDEYLGQYYVRAQSELRAIRECIEREGLVGRHAGDVCNDNHFKLSNGHRWGFSWRAWGDLMQAIVGKREGYMTYYM